MTGIDKLIQQQERGVHEFKPSFPTVEKGTKNAIYPVILSGGAGSRLWPLSREKSPKQFISLVNDHNLFQNTCMRFMDTAGFRPPVIVCNEAHRFQVAESLRSLHIEDATIILEPCARNTAAAVALAALHTLEENENAMMLVCPSDHYIANNDELLQKAINIALSDVDEYLYTFGVKPKAAETGYGYLETGEIIQDNVYSVKRFIEKPNKTVAEKLYQDPSCFWNSGIFLFKAKAYLEALKQYCSDIYQHCVSSFIARKTDLDFIRVDKADFSKCENISIDYAVMERSDKVAMLTLTETDWSDIGSWAALFDLGTKDNNGNFVKGDVFHFDTQNCYLRAYDRLLAVVGLKDLVVVETADAILVADKAKTQEIKAIVTELKQNGRQELEKHKKYYSPWGYSEELTRGDGFIIKKLYFKIGAKSSLHMHFHRREYVSILKGAAEILLEDKVHLLSEGESLEIKPLKKHRITAMGNIPLEMIELQSGSYLGDDDMKRF